MKCSITVPKSYVAEYLQFEFFQKEEGVSFWDIHNIYGTFYVVLYEFKEVKDKGTTSIIYFNPLYNETSMVESAAKGLE